VQQLKAERGISFPDARKAALSEQPTNAPLQTAASVISLCLLKSTVKALKLPANRKNIQSFASAKEQQSWKRW